MNTYKCESFSSVVVINSSSGDGGGGGRSDDGLMLNLLELRIWYTSMQTLSVLFVNSSSWFERKHNANSFSLLLHIDKLSILGKIFMIMCVLCKCITSVCHFLSLSLVQFISLLQLLLFYAHSIFMYYNAIYHISYSKIINMNDFIAFGGLNWENTLWILCLALRNGKR